METKGPMELSEDTSAPAEMLCEGAVSSLISSSFCVPIYVKDCQGRSNSLQRGSPKSFPLRSKLSDTLDR